MALPANEDEGDDLGKNRLPNSIASLLAGFLCSGYRIQPNNETGCEKLIMDEFKAPT
jgi:hypothetical protein